VAAQLFQVDGRTDITKLTVAVRNFANAPKTHVVSITVSNIACNYIYVCTLSDKTTCSTIHSPNLNNKSNLAFFF